MRQVNKRTAGHPSCYLYTSDTSTRRLLPFLAVVRKGYSVPETPSYGTELALGAQNSLLRYATHFQRHSVLKTGFSGTRCVFGGTLCKKQAYLVRQGNSVPETPSYGTELALGAQNSLLRYGMKRPDAAIAWIALI